MMFLIFAPVTHYSMWLLVSWAHCSSTVKSSLADSDHLHDWLKKLTLLVPEVSRSEPLQVLNLVTPVVRNPFSPVIFTQSLLALVFFDLEPHFPIFFFLNCSSVA